MGELGPMRVPRRHRFVLSLVDRLLRLPSAPFATARSQSVLFARGKRAKIKDVYNMDKEGGKDARDAREALGIKEDPLEIEVRGKIHFSPRAAAMKIQYLRL